jgi:hypothetical protein
MSPVELVTILGGAIAAILITLWDDSTSKVQNRRGQHHRR